MSAPPVAATSFSWPPLSALPGIWARALGRLLRAITLGAWQSWVHWVAKPRNRRKLLILPLVLAVHLGIIWLLIQNRWLVMSDTTIIIRPPIMATVVLEPAADGSDGTQAPGILIAPDGIALKTSSDLEAEGPAVQSSVPWFNTQLLPEMRGNDRGRTGKTPQAGQSTKPAAKPAAPKPAPAPKPATAKPAPKAPAKAPAPRARSDSGAELPPPRASAEPPPPPLAIIPPPPPVPPEVTMPAPRPPAPPPAAAAAVPPIPEPVTGAPKEIPPLWQAAPAVPPPALKALPPTPAPSPLPPPVLQALPPTPAPPPPVPAPELPRAAEARPAPAPTPAKPPVAASVAPPPKAVVAPEPVAPPTPLALTPAPQIVPANAEAAPVAPPAPTPPTVAAGASVNSNPANASPAAPAATPVTPAAATRSNPMVVEVPRYKIEDTRAATSGSTSSEQASGTRTEGAAGKADSAGGPRPGGSARAGAEGGSTSGSALGLGAAVPPPLPSTSAPTAARLPPVNINLPRVDVMRPGVGGGGIGPVRQPSLSELANAQLRRGTPRDPVAEAVNSAENPDCVGPDKSGAGLLAGPMAAYRAMTGKCK